MGDGMNIQKFKKELKELLTKHDVNLGVDIDGDTHGIDETNFTVTTNKAPWTEYILCEHEAYIDASDL
jgi:hypothetical protein